MGVWVKRSPQAVTWNTNTALHFPYTSQHSKYYLLLGIEVYGVES